MENGHSQKDRKSVFKTNYRLIQVKSISELSKGAFCNTFDLHKLPFVIKIFVLSIFEWPFFVVHILGQKCILGQTLNMLALA